MHPRTRTGLLTICCLITLLTSALAARPATTPAAAAEQSRIFLPLLAVGGAPTAPAGPSSDELIDAALAAGKLDAETALVYRVYASFGDGRLPAQYRGDDAGAFDSHGLEEAAARWATLAPATRATLTPFFVPPAYAASWANGAAVQGDPGLAADEESPICGKRINSWYYRDTANGHARIWWSQAHPEDGAKAYRLQQEYDGKIWRELRTLMGRSNRSDEGEDCNGGDGRLDIYLVDMGGADKTKGLNVPYGFLCVNTGPTYIQLNREIPEAQLRSAVAHEVMHAVQWAFPTQGGCSRDEVKWWQEATATWAMDFVYPQDNANAEWGYAEHYLGAAELRLNHRGARHEYGAYLFPFYLARTYGNGLIRQSWEAIGGQGSLAAINSVIPGGLTKAWREFVLRNWNGQPKPYDDYATWDGLRERAVMDLDFEVDLKGAPDKAYPLAAPDGTNIGLLPLSARYYHFTFKDAAARGVTFFNGVTFEAQETAAGGSARVEMVPVPAAAREGLTVHALIKVGGVWRAEDWTEKPGAFFCRDRKSERIEELTIVVGNGQWQNQGKVALPIGAPPMVAVSNAGCHQWKGTVTTVRETRHSDGASHSRTTTTAAVTYKPSPPIPGLPYGELGVVHSYHFLPSGVVSWEHENYIYNLAETSAPMCVEKGSGSYPIALGSDWYITGNFLTLYPGRIYKGPLARNYDAGGLLKDAGSYVRTCIASPTETWKADVVYFYGPAIQATHLIAPTGTTITGRHEDDCGSDEEQCILTTTWSLTSVPEQ